MAPQNQPFLSEGGVGSNTPTDRAERAVPVPLWVGPDRGGEKGHGSNSKGSLPTDLLAIGAWTSSENMISADGSDADVTVFSDDRTMLEINVASTASTEGVQSPEAVAIANLYVLILGACENERAGTVFVADYSGQTLVEAQGEGDDASMEGTTETEVAVGDKDDSL